jgi:hypothetical protein
MSVTPAWPHVLDYFGTPLVLEPSPGQLSGDAGPLPVHQFGERIGLTRAHAEAVGGPRAAGLTEHSLSEGARACVVGILAGCPDRDGHGNRLDCGAAQRSAPGRQKQECRTSRASVSHTSRRIAIPPTSCGHIDRRSWEAPSPRNPTPYLCHPRPVNGYLPVSSAKGARGPRATLCRRVLLVEDSRDVAASLALLLGGQGTRGPDRLQRAGSA